MTESVTFVKDRRKFWRDLEKAGVKIMSNPIFPSAGVGLHAKEVHVLHLVNGSTISLIIFAHKLWLLLEERVRGFIRCLKTTYKIKDHYQPDSGFD